MSRSLNILRVWALPTVSAKGAARHAEVGTATTREETPTAAHDTHDSESEATVVRERTARRYLLMSAGSLVLVFGLVWFYVAAFPMAFMSRDYPAWTAQRTILASCNLGAVSIFGDSRAMAGIEPQQLSFQISNFADAGSSPIEAYFTIRREIACKTRPKAIIIAYSTGKYMADVDFWEISVRTGILNLADVLDVRTRGEALHDDEIGGLGGTTDLVPIVRETLFAIRFPSYYFSSLINGYLFGRYFYNHDQEIQILANRGHAFFGTLPGSDVLASEVSMPEFKSSRMVDAYLDSTLSLLSSFKIPVVFLTPPLNEATCKALNPALRLGFTRYIKAKIAAYPDARVEGPIMPCWPDRLFGDGYHLNPTGAAIYSKLVNQYLRTNAGLPVSAPRVAER
jgi:hypothetical protein